MAQRVLDGIEDGEQRPGYWRFLLSTPLMACWARPVVVRMSASLFSNALKANASCEAEFQSRIKVGGKLIRDMPRFSLTMYAMDCIQVTLRG